MTDDKTALLGTGASLFLIGIFGLVSPIASITLAGIMKRSVESFQFLFVGIFIIGVILFVLGIKSGKK